MSEKLYVIMCHGRLMTDDYSHVQQVYDKYARAKARVNHYVKAGVSKEALKICTYESKEADK